MFVDAPAGITASGRRCGYPPRRKVVAGTVPREYDKKLPTSIATLRSGEVTATQVLDGSMTGLRFRE